MSIHSLLKSVGGINQISYANMNQWHLLSIQGIKEVKLMRKEPYFQDNCQKEGREYVRMVEYMRKMIKWQ